MALQSQTYVFTEASIGNAIGVRRGNRLYYKIYGTFSATVLLQKSTSSGSWVTIGTFTGASEGYLDCDDVNGLRYRFVCSAYTSGTVTAFLREVDSLERTELNSDGEPIVEYYRDSVRFVKRVEMPDGKGNVLTSLSVTVGSGSEDYPTIKAALDDVEKWFVSRNATLTVELAEGVHATAETIDLELNNGVRVKIAGQAPETLTFSSLVSITSNGAADHAVVWAVTSAANCSVGDFVNIRGLTGTGEYETLAGCLEITAVDTGTNRITVKVKDRRTSIGACTVTAATIKRHKTVVYSTAANAAMIVRRTLGEGSSAATGLKDFALIGDTSNVKGIQVEYGGRLDLLTEFGIANFGSFGLYGIYGASVGAQNVCVSGCNNNGVYSLNKSVIQFVGGTSTGNNGNGIVASAGSVIAASLCNSSGNLGGMEASALSQITSAGSFLTGNKNYQAISEDGSQITLSTSTVVSTSTYGVRCLRHSSINFADSTISGSGTYDLYAEFKSFIYVNGATYGTISPALETEGNMGSVISNDTLAGNNLSVAGTRNFLAAVTFSSTVAFPSGATWSNVKTATGSHATGSLAAGATSSFTITVSGVANNGNYNVVVSGNGTWPAGLVVTAKVTAADTVTVFFVNASSGAISTGTQTYRVTVFEY